MKTAFFTSLRALLAFTALTGVAYPALVTVVAQVAFPAQANGSLIREGDTVRGSSLIGQPFAGAGYFWSRPSATSPAYNGAASSGSNLGPTNPALADAVKARVAALTAGNPGAASPPVDLVTASGSGLDPDVSPAAAFYQVDRVAAARGLPAEKLKQLVEAHVVGRTLGVLGEPHVNVLELNLALDRLAPPSAPVVTNSP